MPTVDTDPFITSGMSSFIEMLDKVKELRKYKPHFEKIKDNYLQRLEIEMKEYHKYRRNDRYYVLCHGDFHLRNMMFRHNKELGAYDDVMLVDFQFSNLCPITVDLTYSIYMLMEPEQRWEMGEDLINEYFSVLVATLRKIGYKGDMPTQSKLWEQIQNNKYYDFFLISTLLPVMIAVKSNEFMLHEVLQDSKVRQKSYFLEAYIKDVSKLLPKFEKLGYFNDL
ncbi:GD12944 [Drosophila simulans]|uniref:GD12944 n=2 Tax=Drosophila simulans TaxID=7240 RepID=B4NW15_DROSI|nr:GD12944 [Drosophila simulans]